jgi:hypothetical protein
VATVIDSLVVLLGLDASKYKQGRETAEKETKETARVAKNSADEITKSLTEVGRTIAGLFLGFESATGFAKWLGELNAGEASLGRTAKSINMSAHELNKWGNAVSLAGGSATDAQSAFRQLTEDFTKMQTTGEQSALLQFFRARGVNVRDENGALRNQGELFEELADKTAKYGAVYQATMFRQAGLNEGEINYLVQAKAQRDQYLAQAERSNQITADSVAEAQRLQQEWRNVTQEIAAAGQAVLKDLAPPVLFVLNRISQIAELVRLVVNTLSPFERNSVDEIDRRKSAAQSKYADYLKAHPDVKPDKTTEQVEQEAADQTRLGPIAYAPPATSKAARFNNPGNILDKQGNERNYKTMAEGQAALENDLAIKMSRGLKTVDAIITAYEGGDSVRNDIPGYIADVRQRLGKNELSESDIKQLAQAIAIHESGFQSGPTPGLASARKVDAQPAGSTTNVSVGTIQVNAPNADPRAVAEQVPSAIQRKFTVTQADTGQS